MEVLVLTIFSLVFLIIIVGLAIVLLSRTDSGNKKSENQELTKTKKINVLIEKIQLKKEARKLIPSGIAFFFLAHFLGIADGDLLVTIGVAVAAALVWEILSLTVFAYLGKQYELNGRFWWELAIILTGVFLASLFYMVLAN